MSGWVRNYRRLWKHPVFRNRSEAGVFAWMIAQAAWKKMTVRYKERVIVLERGQLAASIRDISNSFEMPVGVVRGLTKRLKSNTMINTASNTGVNVITICNYDEYQQSEVDANTPTNTGDNTPPTHPQHTEQEDNNINNNIVPLPKPSKRNDYPSEFEAFWSVYPKRPTDTKARAYRSWSKAIKTVDPDVLREAAERYAKYCAAENHPPKLVSTWVGDEGWTANLKTSKPTLADGRKVDWYGDN